MKYFSHTTLFLATAAILSITNTGIVHAGQASTADSLSEGIIPELFEHPDGFKPELSGSIKNASVIYQMMLGDGWVDFVLQPNHSIGIAFVGELPAKAVTTLLNTYKATPLEVFVALNESRDATPKELISAHLNTSREEVSVSKVPRQLPDINQLLSGTAQAAGFVGEDFSGPGACSGSQNFDYFENWYDTNGPTGVTLATNNPSYKDLGVKGVSDSGIDSGSGNITLDGSSGGSIVFCKTGGPAGKPILRISEAVAGIGWVWIYQFNNVMNSGTARGYYFGGYAYRHVRMEIRDAAGVEYFWAASY